jgi:endogenous inhibitor of DNA gyrase (YacG/DUF329 family)
MDLAAWADERYRIPGDPIPADADEGAEPPRDGSRER